MRKQLFAGISLCLALSLAGCGKTQESTTQEPTTNVETSTNTETDATNESTKENDTTQNVATNTDIDLLNEDTPEQMVKTEDMLYHDVNFVLYKDGKNNYVDVFLDKGSVDVISIPEEYRNYKTLLNHSFEYFPISYDTIETENAKYNIIAADTNAIEVDIDFLDYRIRTIMPQEIQPMYNNSKFTSGGYEYDEETNTKLMKSNVWYNYNQTTDNIEEINTPSYCSFLYVKSLSDDDYNKYKAYIQDEDSLKSFVESNSNIKITNNTFYTTKEDDDFIYGIVSNVITHENTDDETTGTFIYALDKKNKMQFYQYIGVPTDDFNTKYNDTTLSYLTYKEMIDTIPTTYRIMRK